MTVMKEMQFPVSVRWRGGRSARAESRDKEPLQVATPAEFPAGSCRRPGARGMLVGAHQLLPASC